MHSKNIKTKAAFTKTEMNNELNLNMQINHIKYQTWWSLVRHINVFLFCKEAMTYLIFIFKVKSFKIILYILEMVLKSLKSK